MTKCILTISEQKLVTLKKVLEYINNRPQQMNVDTIFGVTLCEGKNLLLILMPII